MEENRNTILFGKMALSLLGITSCIAALIALIKQQLFVTAFTELIVGIIVSGILIFYLVFHENLFWLERVKRNLFLFCWLVSLLCLYIPQKQGNMSFFFIGIVFITKIIDIQVGIVSHISLSILSIVVSGIGTKEIVIQLLVGCFLCLCIEKMDSFINLIYAVISLIVSILSILVVMEKFQFEIIAEKDTIFLCGFCIILAICVYFIYPNKAKKEEKVIHDFVDMRLNLKKPEQMRETLLQKDNLESKEVINLLKEDSSILKNTNSVRANETVLKEDTKLLKESINSLQENRIRLNEESLQDIKTLQNEENLQNTDILQQVNNQHRNNQTIENRNSQTVSNQHRNNPTAENESVENENIDNQTAERLKDLKTEDIDAENTKFQEISEETMQEKNIPFQDGLMEKASEKEVQFYEEEEETTSFENMIFYERLQTITDSNFDLLVRLEKEAPKLYEHSRQVAELSGSAADAIGADIWLAYAGGWYHEIGKLQKGQDYIEDGINLAYEYELTPQVADIIKQQNFKVNLPQTKEAALVLLSDGIFSAIDYLKSKNKTEYSVEQIIGNTFHLRFEKGILNEAGFSLQEFYYLKQYYRSAFSEKENDE